MMANLRDSVEFVSSSTFLKPNYHASDTHYNVQDLSHHTSLFRHLQIHQMAAGRGL